MLLEHLGSVQDCTGIALPILFTPLFAAQVFRDVKLLRLVI